MELTILTLLLILSLGALYAVALNWAEKTRGLVTEFTWVTVAIGTVVTVGPLAIILPWQHMALVLAAFVASGTPVVVWCLWREHENRVEAERHDRTQAPR